MEPIAVNRITVTEALFAEGFDAVFSKRRQKTLLYCGIVFLVFGLILLARQARLPVATALSFPALLTGVIVIIWALTLHRSELKRKYRAFRLRNGDAPDRVIECYRDHLVVSGGPGEPVQIDYPDIREYRETANLLLLICENHTGVHLSKGGFTTGDWDTLWTAIQRSRQQAEEARALLEG